MDRQIQILLNRVSCASVTIATITLLLLFLQTPDTCVPEANPKPHLRFPKSSCDSSHRELIPIEKKNRRLWSTKDWLKKVSSFTSFFIELRELGHLKNKTKVLCVSAGAGQEVRALLDMGVADVTGVELVDSPPLVSRADPHNLPFFDGVFDLAFTAHLAEALFPSQFVSEMERTVRIGGMCVLVVEEEEDLRDIISLFRKSQFISAENVILIGLKMTRIIMRIRTA